jgi:glycosyltransferase involved in cell wall biosynthesis
MRKRLAILTPSIPPYRRMLYEELRYRFEDLIVLVSAAEYFDGTLATRQRSLSISAKWRHPRSFTEQHNILIPYDTVPQLRRFRPDVIIAHEMGARSIQAAAYRAMSPSTRLVLWATLSEETEQGRGLLRPIIRKALLRITDSVMVNGASGNRYIGRFGVAPKKIFSVPQTTNIAPFLATPQYRDEPAVRRLIYSGRLVELKGLLPFLEELSSWAIAQPEKRAELWIVGGGPLAGVLSQFKPPANLEIKLLGQVSYDRLPEIYRQGGILVLPTLADEWGLVVVEAMASGMPVLGSIYSQAVEELVTDGITGWTFRPDRPAEIQAVLRRVFNEAAPRLRQMGAAARSSVSGMTPAAMADQMMAAVEYACANRS